MWGKVRATKGRPYIYFIVNMQAICGRLKVAPTICYNAIFTVYAEAVFDRLLQTEKKVNLRLTFSSII